MARARARFVVAVTFVAGVLCAPGSSRAQAFSSGSTGADGALDLATMNCPNQLCEVQLPPSGVLNYTTVTVPAGVALVFRKNLNNTPVVMLAQGQVQIAGQIFVTAPACYGIGNGSPREPGPGGFAGGDYGQPGFGPGGGTPPTMHGQWIGPLSLVPVIGGSGGAGGSGNQGVGGAGAIVVASSTSIVVTGSVLAVVCQSSNGAGTGSGGAVRLVSNSVSVSGSGVLRADPAGVIRLEAPQGALAFNGSATPAAVLSDVNPAIFSAQPASLTITSVGGFAVPVYSGQRFDTVDVLLPSQLPDPIPVVVTASNIPPGTQVGITFGTTNAGTVVPGTLSGTQQSSTATIQVSGLNRSALAFLFVQATFSVPSSAQPASAGGPDRIAQVRASSAPGGPTRFAFLRDDGSEVPRDRVPPALLRQFTP